MIKQMDDRSPEFIVLASVEEMGTCTANDVAKMSHFSITKVQHVLKILQRAGLVKIGMGGAE
jgi:DNA-binding MarR family transcriptional regulator